MRMFFLALTSTVLLLTSAWAGPPRTVEVLPDIYTVTDFEDGGGNATFMVTGDGVILIDSGPSPAAGEFVKKAIGETTDQPVRYILNTHYHGDNTFGNQAFSGHVPILGTVYTAKSMLSEFGQKAEESYNKRHPEAQLKMTAPNITFEAETNLALGKYFLRLITVKSSHTRGDLYVYIPSYRLIITGGLVNNGEIPDLSEAVIGQWIESLRKMEDLDAETIIPGHGKPGDKPTVTLMKHYLMQLRDFVKAELRDGGSLPDIQKKVGEKLKARYSSWKYQDRIDKNIERAFLEFLGK